MFKSTKKIHDQQNEILGLRQMVDEQKQLNQKLLHQLQNY